MMSAPGALLQKAADLGLKLQPEGNNLRITPARLCSANFMDALRQQKKELLHLLRLPFVMVYSERLGETLFFCEDEPTKRALVEAGACEWSIYTKAELRTLCAQNRIAPISLDELRKVHEIRKTFDGRITK